jgi:hypothetical protein
MQPNVKGFGLIFGDFGTFGDLIRPPLDDY